MQLPIRRTSLDRTHLDTRREQRHPAPGATSEVPCPKTFRFMDITTRILVSVSKST